MIKSVIFLMADYKLNCGNAADAIAGTFAIGAIIGGPFFWGTALLTSKNCMGNCTPDRRCAACTNNKKRYISDGIGGACVCGALALVFG